MRYLKQGASRLHVKSYSEERNGRVRNALVPCIEEEVGRKKPSSNDYSDITSQGHIQWCATGNVKVLDRGLGEGGLRHRSVWSNFSRGKRKHYEGEARYLGT